MKKLWTVIVFLSIQNISLSQSEKVSVETLAIINRDFLVANDWGEVPIDKQGNDLNSSKFGSIYYPPYMEESQLQENRSTIARGFMEIELLFNNRTSDSWRLKEIKLEVLEDYDYSSMDCTEGIWEIGSRSSGFNPYLKIIPEQSTIKSNTEDFTLWPMTEEEDSGLIVEVAAPKGEKVIYHFSLNFTYANSNGDTMKIQPKKTFLVASDL
jgi:hypothetical protein